MVTGILRFTRLIGCLKYYSKRNNTNYIELIKQYKIEILMRSKTLKTLTNFSNITYTKIKTTHIKCIEINKTLYFFKFSEHEKYGIILN